MLGTDYPIVELSWSEYDSLARCILGKIHGCIFNCVVIVLRGGSVLGLTIANSLDLPTFYIRVRRSVSDSVNSGFADPAFLGEIGLSEIKDKDVLVCEDIIDTEMTIGEVVGQLEKYHPRSIRIATLFNFSKNDGYISGLKADYHFWVVFPWEKRIYEQH